MRLIGMDAKWASAANSPGCAAHAELLVGLGFDELSVAPPSVPAVKERIRGLETPQAELTARRAVEAATASEVHELIGVG